MHPQHYALIKVFRIYALFLLGEDGEKIIYIGKTAGRRLSAVYSNHIHMKNTATEPFFGTEATERPSLHLLETLQTTTADAYRHVLCWIYLFQKKDYRVINHEKMQLQASHLHPQTLDILKTIPQEDLPELLMRTRLVRLQDADLPPSPPSKSEPTPDKNTQLSIRLTESEKARFNRFAEKLRRNQRETFLYLLESSTGNHREAIQSSRRAEKTIHKLKQKNSQLQKHLSQLEQQTAPEFQRIAILQKNHAFYCRGLSLYLQQCLPPPTEKTPLPSMHYKKFKRLLPDGLRYDYPSEVGFAIIRPEAILYGNHSAWFLVGLREDGSRCKLRMYPKASNMGIPIKSDYGMEGSLWFLGWQKAADGAMDLVFAIPLPPPMPQQTSVSVSSTMKKTPLDDQIANAATRRG